MINNKLLLFFLLVLFSLLSMSCGLNYDIIISGGQIYNGSGNEPFVADIGITSGKITAVGSLGKNALKIIDATGMYIAPGFIDMHTHCDQGLQDNDRKNAVNYLTQGVTTVVTGNCGSGTYEVADYFARMERQGIGTNVVHLVGHGAIRRGVMEQSNAAPTESELNKMKALLNKALEEGAVGMATGLFYAPGNYAETEEVIELAKEIKNYNGIYASHIRDESNYSIGLLDAVKEAIEIGEKAEIPVQISHIKALGKPVWNTSSSVTDVIEAAHQRGQKVYADQYPYVASSTSLIAATIPRWVQANGQLRTLLTDEKQLPQIKREIAQNIDRRGGPETLVVANFRQKPEWEGKSVQQISEILGKDAVDTAIELALMGGPGVVSFNMQEDDLLHFMKKPYVMTASDGNIPRFQQGAPHPRSYGTFPRKIREYVLNKKAITMEAAIRSSTSLPAGMLGLKDRGILKENTVADLIIFDPQKIADKATFDQPHQYSEGIEYVFVNGEIVIEKGEYNNKLAGKPLRHKIGQVRER